MRRLNCAILLSLAAAIAVVVTAAAQPVPVQIQPVKRPIRGGTAVTQPALSDDQALAKANLNAADGGKLIEYLRQRTLTETEQSRIEAVIKRFGAEDFDDREKATVEVEAFGSAAIGPLKTAEKDADPEVAYRARLALRRVETVPHAAVAAAAVRAVVKLRPDGAATALIGFLPLADDEEVSDVIREALVTLAVGKDGKAEPALLAALSDPSPIRRRAAYVALITGGTPGERIRIKDAYPKVREAVAKESDTDSRFLGFWTLALTTREKAFIPELLNLIPKLPRGRIWQLEDLLLQIAGAHPKDGRFLRSPDSLARTRDAWLGWWKDKGEALDLIRFDYKPRVLGFTDIVESDVRFNGPGRVSSLGHDLKLKWQITGVNYPTDMSYVSSDKVIVVESNNNWVTELNTAGKVLKRRNVYNQPLNINVLPDGRELVVCRNNVFQFDKTGKQLWNYQRTNFHDIMTGHSLPNGDTLVVTINNQGGPQKTTAIRVNDKGKETGKTYTFGLVQNLQSMHAFDKEKVLVCEWTAVAEYDLSTGKQTWKYDCTQPSSCQRLSNGNTLISQMNYGNSGRIIEVDPSGEIVWMYEGRDGLRVSRAYRR